MTTSDTVRPATTRSNVVLLVTLRIVGAALLVGMAWIHYHLWGLGYSSVSLIGPLFLTNAIVGVLLAVVVLFIPGRLLAITSALSSLFTLGTLAALLVSIFWGLFGFVETFSGPLVKTTLAVEIAGVVLLAVLAAVAAQRSGMWDWTSRSATDPVR
jgi:hypothetical protein